MTPTIVGIRQPGVLDVLGPLDVVGRHAERIADLGQTGGVGALAAADRQDQVDLILLDQALQRVLPLGGRLADRVAEAELAAFRHHHRLQLSGRRPSTRRRSWSSGRRRRPCAAASTTPSPRRAARGVPGQVGDLLGRDRFRRAGPADHAAHLRVVGIAVDDQEVALAHQLLRQPLHLGHQRAGGVDQLHARRRRLRPPGAAPCRGR